MDPHVGRLARLLLGAAFLAYFLGTALLFFWGPWHYPMDRGSGPLIRFLLAANLAFVLGYVAGIKRTAARRQPSSDGRDTRARRRSGGAPASLSDFGVHYRPLDSGSTRSGARPRWPLLGEPAPARVRARRTVFYLRMLLAPLLGRGRASRRLLLEVALMVDQGAVCARRWSAHSPSTRRWARMPAPATGSRRSHGSCLRRILPACSGFVRGGGSRSPSC